MLMQENVEMQENVKVQESATMESMDILIRMQATKDTFHTHTLKLG